MRTSGEHISLETEVPVEGEHISPTVHTEEHISAGRGKGYVCGETHITGEHMSALLSSTLLFARFCPRTKSGRRTKIFVTKLRQLKPPINESDLGS